MQPKPPTLSFNLFGPHHKHHPTFQDNYLCEAFKMRNLLTELLPSIQGKFHLFADDDHEFQVSGIMSSTYCAGYAVEG